MIKIIKKRRWLIFGAVLLLILIGGGVVLARKRAVKEVKTEKAVRKELILSVSASGEVVSKKEVVLKFQTSGQLAWIGVKQGDRVKKWQAIAALDRRELQKSLEKELLDYMNERWDFEQDRDDYDVSVDDLDRYSLSGAARRVLEKAQFDLNRDVLDVEIADISLKLANLISPIEGIVTEIDVPVAGVNITPATATFTIADPNEVVFEADIDEIDIAGVREGQSAILNLDAYLDEEMETTITEVAFQSETGSGGGTVFPVKLKLPENKDLKFKLGMNGDIEIILKKKENALSIPSSAVMKRGEKNYVFVVEKGVARKKEVTIGLETDEESEILEGLEDKDEVVVEKISQIKDGQKVK